MAFCFERVVEGLDPGACVRDAQARRVVGAAEILELGGIVERLRPVIEQRTHDRAGKDRADDRAVLGRDAVDEGRGAAAAGAGLVLRNDGRIARNETVEMPADDAHVDVVAAADVAADDEVDALAGVVVRGRRGRRDQADGGRGDGERARSRTVRQNAPSSMRRRAFAQLPDGADAAMLRTASFYRKYPAYRHADADRGAMLVRRPDIPNATVAIATSAQAAMKRNTARGWP